MDFLHNFHFLRPYLLIMLVLPFIVLWYVKLNAKLVSSWANVCDEHLLRFLLIKRDDNLRKKPHLRAFFVLFIGILSLAGPTWIKKEVTSLQIDNPVMIVMNLSDEMWKNDVSPNRAEREKYVVKDLLSSIKNAQTGLIVYAKEPYMITPLVEDSSVIDNLLGNIEPDIIPENGDRLDRAIDYAVERIKQAGYKTGEIIVLTSDIISYFDNALNSAENAKKQGYNVNVIKINTDKSEKLALLADKGNGKYFDYRQDMQILADRINKAYNNKMHESVNKQVIWDDMGYYLFWIPAFLLLYYFRRGVFLVFILSIFTCNAHASWFLNNNQEAMDYFNKGDFAKAAETFSDNNWRGVSAYRMGDYDKAFQSFSKGDSLTDLYNQGNSLAKAGKIDEAIKKYEEVLQKDADFEDARFNLEYLKKQQQKQNNKQSANKQDENTKNENDNQKSERVNGENEQRSSESEKDDKNRGLDENSDNLERSQAKQNNTSDKEKGKDEKGEVDQQNVSEKEKNTNNNGEENNSSNMQKQNTEKKNTENKYTVSENQNENKKGDQEVKSAVLGDNEDEKKEKKEKIRAHMQKFRDIPEDKGGLLRAFIAKEHQKQRYERED